ncbi:MAG: PilZ domain-containing protein [Candidatus Omnitrophica bacterium]|nr:PilZ domain-containing protein [Candidatus Omnitrophota bacterium]
MSTKKTAQERRESPRLANNIPLKLIDETGDIVTESVNISRSGLYCRVNRYIEPMVKLKVNLLLPVRKNGKNSSRKIACEGVVVRIEEAQEQDHYNIAVFFNDITQRDAESIADYIGTFME